MQNIHQSGDKTSPTTASRIGVEYATRAAVFAGRLISEAAATLTEFREGPQERPESIRTDGGHTQKPVRQTDNTIDDIDPDRAAEIVDDKDRSNPRHRQIDTACVTHYSGAHVLCEQSDIRLQGEGTLSLDSNEFIVFDSDSAVDLEEVA